MDVMTTVTAAAAPCLLCGYSAELHLLLEMEAYILRPAFCEFQIRTETLFDARNVVVVAVVAPNFLLCRNAEVSVLQKKCRDSPNAPLASGGRTNMK